MCSTCLFQQSQTVELVGTHALLLGRRLRSLWDLNARVREHRTLPNKYTVCVTVCLFLTLQILNTKVTESTDLCTNDTHINRVAGVPGDRVECFVGGLRPLSQRLLDLAELASELRVRRLARRWRLHLESGTLRTDKFTAILSCWQVKLKMVKETHVVFPSPRTRRVGCVFRIFKEDIIM